MAAADVTQYPYLDTIGGFHQNCICVILIQYQRVLCSLITVDWETIRFC